MANALYRNAASQVLLGEIDFVNDVLMVALVDTDVYTFDGAHVFASELAGAVLGTPAVLTGKSVTNGVFDANNVTFSGFSGPTAEAVVVYRANGGLGTSELLMYWDTAVAGLPVIPNGGDITLAWSDGPSKILAL